ncbi:MAG: hypothetical protein R2737_02025 [Candidatus Nanopelagicales bacterium]
MSADSTPRELALAARQRAYSTSRETGADSTRLDPLFAEPDVDDDPAARIRAGRGGADTTSDPGGYEGPSARELAQRARDRAANEGR